MTPAASPTIGVVVEHMFDSAVQRHGVAPADAGGAARRPAGRLDRIAALPPGPLAMGLLDRVVVPDLDADGRVPCCRPGSGSPVGGVAPGCVRRGRGRRHVRPTATTSSAEHVRIATRECGGSARAEVDTARALAGPLSCVDVAARAGPGLVAARAGAGPGDRGPRPGHPAGGEPRRSSPTWRRLRPAASAGHRPSCASGPARGDRRRPGRRAAAAPRRRGSSVTWPAGPTATPRRACSSTVRRSGSRPSGRRWTSGPSSTSADDERTLDQRDGSTRWSTSAGWPPPTTRPAGRRLCRRIRLTLRRGRGLRHAPRRPAGPGGASGATAPAWSRLVFVFADAATWAGLADEPVELDGYGPIPAGVARECFTDATWRAVVDGRGDRGCVVGLRTPLPALRQDPAHALREGPPVRLPRLLGRGLVLRRRPLGAARHGGCTDTENCGLFCRRHRRLKTFTAWRWRRLPDGALEWTDPSGRTWRRGPSRSSGCPR